MDKRCEQVFPNSSKHEKILSFITHEGNANSNHNVMLPHTQQNGESEHNKRTLGGYENVVQPEFSYSDDGNIKFMQALLKTTWKI